MKSGLGSIAPDKDWKQFGIYLTSFRLNYYGIYSTLHSDQGRNFESGIFQDLCRMLEIKKTGTSARNPRCNCQTERFNRTLEDDKGLFEK